MIGLDTETTGVDLHHGAMPYFVTFANESGENIFYEWDVDPLTRKPIVPEEDLDEIGEMLNPYNRDTDYDSTGDGLIVLQNPKFDVQALSTVREEFGEDWVWENTLDTLLASHLLASNQPHDLTSLAIIYLGINLQPLDDALKVACMEARRIAKAKYPDWAIAAKGRLDMPSAKESVWKFDGWLPRAIAKHEGYSKDHPWWTVLSEYGNGDSAIVIPLYQAMIDEIEKRGLEKIYAERLKLLKIVYRMEKVGVTVSGSRLRELQKEYQEESENAGNLCRNIAASYGYELELPKSGNNKSLLSFIFGEEGLGLPALKTSKKTGAPSLDKGAIESYQATLPDRSKAKMFITALRDKRKRDTALSYMESYERYWLPLGVYNEKREQLWYLLHPSLNSTGTDTLRWSSSNPNEQNISKQEGFNLRYAFGPAPGREWWSLDAANIELRIPAYESGETELIDLFERSDEPPYYGSTHLLNFSTVYPDIWEKELKAVGYEKVGPHCKKKYKSSYYQWCKNGGFAVQYGAVEREGGTADLAFHRDGSHAKLKARFSKLEKHNQWCIAQAEKYGYVETIPDREVDPEHGYPLLCTRSRWGGILPTVPLNYRTQGTAMWWMMKAMIRCNALLEDYNQGRVEEARVHMVMQVHDELVFDCPKTEVDPRTVKNWKTDKFNYLRTNLPLIHKIQKTMARGGDDIGVKTPVSVEYHPDNWSEGISL